MKVLALELSSSVGSIAFCEDETTRTLRAFPADRKDSAFFYENLEAISEQHGPADLIVVGLGPGSYAGIRIAIATALGLRAAWQATLRGLSSVAALEREEYFFIGDARRDSYFFARVAEGKCMEGPTLANEAEVQAKLKENPHLPALATQLLPAFAQVMVEHPSALRLARLAQRGEGGNEEILEPIYLRGPYITTAKK